MARMIFTGREREGLSQADIALLHEYILDQIQTSAEIRAIIGQRPEALLQRYPRIRQILRRKVSPLRQRLQQQTKASAARGGRKRKKGGRRKKR